MTEKATVRGKNRGEWSEPYVFLRLAGSARLVTANEHLQPTEIRYPLLKILGHAERVPGWTYILVGALRPDYAATGAVEIIDTVTQETVRVDAVEFGRHADLLLRAIIADRRQDGNGARTFNVPPVRAFLERVKYGPASKKKSDIRVVIHDAASGREPELGFSIKSYLGSPPTLFNASRSTRLRFRVTGVFSEADVAAANALAAPKKTVQYVLSRSGAGLAFDAPDNPVFERSLRVIDSRLPELLADMVLAYFAGRMSGLAGITGLLASRDPLGIGPTPAAFYDYKVKAMLTDMALGLTATEPWTGIYTATGGFIIVNTDGDVLCYHIYNRNDFQDLLFRSTKFDTPSRRTRFGVIEGTPGNYILNLNFQIRFK